MGIAIPLLKMKRLGAAECTPRPPREEQTHGPGEIVRAAGFLNGF
jgi:hypothetical protein